jgi:hypothetical protein
MRAVALLLRHRAAVSSCALHWKERWRRPASTPRTRPCAGRFAVQVIQDWEREMTASCASAPPAPPSSTTVRTSGRATGRSRRLHALGARIAVRRAVGLHALPTGHALRADARSASAWA